MDEMAIPFYAPADTSEVDALVVRAAQQGDLDAFNRLVELFQDSVFGTAYSILGVAEDAEDAVQTTFLRAFQHLASFRNGSFHAWILRIVTNVCYDRLRSQKRHPTSSIDAEGEDGSDWSDYLPDHNQQNPLDAVESADLSQWLQQCLISLPQPYRTVAYMVDVEGLDYREVSYAISKPVGTVKSRLARARLRIRECMSRTYWMPKE